MITLKSKKEIDILREGGKHLAAVLFALKKASVAGVSTKELDDIAYKMTKDFGDTPAFLDYQPDGASRPYPASACISINNEIVHGIPNESVNFKRRRYCFSRHGSHSQGNVCRLCDYCGRGEN